MIRLAKLITVVNRFAQLALVILTGMYLVETRKLRIQSQDQLEAFRTEAWLGHVPSVIAGITDINSQNLIRQIESDSTVPSQQKNKNLQELKANPYLFTCSVTNISEKLPFAVQAFIYDASTRSFLQADQSQEAIADNTSVFFNFRPPRQSADESLAAIEAFYGVKLEFLKTHFVTEPTSYLAIVFQDVTGLKYLLKRPFTFDEHGKLQNAASSLFWPQ